MFVGTFEHSLDEKGRLILPSSFRDPFGAGAYLTKQIDGCLALMTESEFKDQAAERLKMAKAGREARNIARAFAAGSTQVSPDKQGRIAIPALLRSFAELDRSCVVTGALTHVEIWSEERWNASAGEGDAALIAGDETDLHVRLLLDEEGR